MKKNIPLQPAAAPDAQPAATLFAAPHRSFFLAGALQTLLAFAPWAWELLARAGLVAAPTWPWPPGWIHGLEAAYGIFPFFVFGFLLTAMPRWQGMPDTPGSAARLPWALLAGGWLAFDAGVLTDAPMLRGAGLALILSGWLLVLRALAPVAFKPGSKRLHAATAWCALAAGALGLAAWLGYSLTGAPRLARIGIEAGVWWMLAPIFMAVSHRMIPFFSASALPQYTPYKPDWSLLLLVAASALHGALAMADLAAWAWPTDLAAAATALWLSWKWQLRRSFAVRLLAMLHVGFVWLGVAWLLAGVQGLLQVCGINALGLAPLHAMAVGFFATMSLAMVSRVTLGHSGRPLVADALTWRLCLALHGIAALRVAADLLPAVGPVLLLVAVLGWLGLFGLWAVRVVPIYLHRRADGKPG